MFNNDENYDKNTNIYVKSQSIILKNNNGNIEGNINGYQKHNDKEIKYSYPLSIPRYKCNKPKPQKIIVIPNSLKYNFNKNKQKYKKANRKKKESNKLKSKATRIKKPTLKKPTLKKPTLKKPRVKKPTSKKV